MKIISKASNYNPSIISRRSYQYHRIPLYNFRPQRHDSRILQRNMILPTVHRASSLIHHPLSTIPPRNITRVVRRTACNRVEVTINRVASLAAPVPNHHPVGSHGCSPFPLRWPTEPRVIIQCRIRIRPPKTPLYARTSSSVRSFVVVVVSKLYIPRHTQEMVFNGDGSGRVWPPDGGR